MELKENERINIINENLRLIENKDSLTFGTDAYLLSAFLPKRKNATYIELGVGSGVISLLALSKEKCQQVYGFEVQEEIADIAKRNAILNQFEDNFTVISKDLRLATINDIGKEADVVFSNPPYMKKDSGKANENDNKNASRHEIFGEINDFCICAKKLLRFGGDFCVVYRSDRLIDLICALRNNGLEPKKLAFIHANSHTPPSLLLISAKLGGKSGLTIEKPVYIYKDGTTEYTEQFKHIYDTCSFEEKL